MSTTRLQEILIGFGSGKRADIATANDVSAIWHMRKLNAALANPKLNTENGLPARRQRTTMLTQAVHVCSAA